MVDPSSSREIAIAILPKFSGFFSILGSGFIIYDILCSHFNIPLKWWVDKKSDEELASSQGFSRSSAMTRSRSSSRFGKRKTLKNSAYYRLMLSMSCSDFLVSFAWFMTTWPIPKDENSLDSGSVNPSESVYGNIGTQQTCTAQAFFIQLGIITPFYNGLLAIYYYLTIRHEWKEEDFKKKVEYIGHFVAISFGLGTSIAGLVMGIFHNSVVWCWINSYPIGCGDGPDQTPCESGANSRTLRWAFYYGPLWVMIFFVALFMSLVYFYVRGLDVKMDKYTNTYRKNAARSNPEESTEIEARRSFMSRTFSTTKMETIKEQRKQRKNERSKAVANQGLFYAGTFALVWVFGTIVRAMQLAGAKPPWAIVFLFAVFTPSQGFFNFLVYIRPRVIKYFQQRKKLKNRRPSCSNRDDSISSNVLHVSGISCGSSSEVQGADASSKSDEKFDLKLTDPYLSTTPGNTDAETTEPSTVKTALDSGIEDSATTS